MESNSVDVCNEHPMICGESDDDSGKSTIRKEVQSKIFLKKTEKFSSESCGSFDKCGSSEMFQSRTSQGVIIRDSEMKLEDGAAKYDKQSTNMADKVHQNVQLKMELGCNDSCKVTESFEQAIRDHSDNVERLQDALCKGNITGSNETILFTESLSNTKVNSVSSSVEHIPLKVFKTLDTNERKAAEKSGRTSENVYECDKSKELFDDDDMNSREFKSKTNVRNETRCIKSKDTSFTALNVDAMIDVNTNEGENLSKESDVLQQTHCGGQDISNVDAEEVFGQGIKSFERDTIKEIESDRKISNAKLGDYSAEIVSGVSKILLPAVDTHLQKSEATEKSRSCLPSSEKNILRNIAAEELGSISRDEKFIGNTNKGTYFKQAKKRDETLIRENLSTQMRASKESDLKCNSSKEIRFELVTYAVCDHIKKEATKNVTHRNSINDAKHNTHAETEGKLSINAFKPLFLNENASEEINLNRSNIVKSWNLKQCTFDKGISFEKTDHTKKYTQDEVSDIDVLGGIISDLNIGTDLLMKEDYRMEQSYDLVDGKNHKVSSKSSKKQDKQLDDRNEEHDNPEVTEDLSQSPDESNRVCEALDTNIQHSSAERSFSQNFNGSATYLHQTYNTSNDHDYNVISETAQTCEDSQNTEAYIREHEVKNLLQEESEQNIAGSVSAIPTYKDTEAPSRENIADSADSENIYYRMPLTPPENSDRGSEAHIDLEQYLNQAARPLEPYDTDTFLCKKIIKIGRPHSQQRTKTSCRYEFATQTSHRYSAEFRRKREHSGSYPTSNKKNCESLVNDNNPSSEQISDYPPQRSSENIVHLKSFDNPLFSKEELEENIRRYVDSEADICFEIPLPQDIRDIMTDFVETSNLFDDNAEPEAEGSWDCGTDQAFNHLQESFEQAIRDHSDNVERLQDVLSFLISDFIRSLEKSYNKK